MAFTDTTQGYVSLLVRSCFLKSGRVTVRDPTHDLRALQTLDAFAVLKTCSMRIRLSIRRSC